MTLFHLCPFRSFVGFGDFCTAEDVAVPGTFQSLSPEYQPLKIYVWHSPPVAPYINLVKFQVGVVYVSRHITPSEAGDCVKLIMPEHLWSSMSCDLHAAYLDLVSPTGFSTRITEIIIKPGRLDPSVPACFDAPAPTPPPSMSPEFAGKRPRASHDDADQVSQLAQEMAQLDAKRARASQNRPEV